MKFTEDWVESCLVQRMYRNGLNMCLQQRAWVKKIVDGVETHWLTSKG